MNDITKKQVEILGRLDDILDDIEQNFKLDKQSENAIINLRTFILRTLTARNIEVIQTIIDSIKK